jgi:hypothetical protein
MAKDTLVYKEALEGLLMSLGWATNGKNMTGPDLDFLIRDIYRAYKALGFEDKDLPATLLNRKLR